jgi:hypothetical protein
MSARCGSRKSGKPIRLGRPAHEGGYGIRILGARSVTAGNDGASNKTASLPAGVAVTDPSLCGTGTLKAHVDLNAPMPNTYPFNSYDDTLTLVLSPV